MVEVARRGRENQVLRKNWRVCLTLIVNLGQEMIVEQRRAADVACGRAKPFSLVCGFEREVIEFSKVLMGRCRF